MHFFSPNINRPKRFLGVVDSVVVVVVVVEPFPVEVEVEVCRTKSDLIIRVSQSPFVEGEVDRERRFVSAFPCFLGGG